MSGNVAQNGAELCLNHMAGRVVPVVGSATPTWIPGLYWVDTSTGSAPAAPTLSQATTGGTVAAGTYQGVITYVNAWGETVGSAPASVTTTTGTSTITANSPAANGTATGWYLYLSQAGGTAASATRQQAAGSPTAIGTNLTLTAPPTNTGATAPVYSEYAVKSWNGSAWVTTPAAGSRYLALLVADPSTSGPGGTPAVNVSDLIEDSTTGYARQLISFSNAVSGIPNKVSNSGTITFGPYGANMAAPAQWAAMVTSASGTSGLLLYTWALDTPQQVDVSQSIIIPAGSLQLDE